MFVNLKTTNKETKAMIIVTREEAAELRDKVRGVHITKTCKFKNKSSRGRYYVEPTKTVLRIIADIRKCKPDEIT